MKKLFFLIMVVFFVSVSSAEAAAQRFSPPAMDKQISCNPIGKGAAMSAAASRVKGRVLSAYLNTNTRPPIYRVKVISESGRVRYVTVNACNGMVLA
ncbi:MAG: hypothetical protein HWD86_10620 [Kangiellaceae bacterium]|nr:hypothetical protein [Kangiellaceae bacterium]